MNIAKILKDAPVGTKLYCTILGDAILENVDLTSHYPIKIRSVDKSLYESLSVEGKLYINCPDSDCILFPSKENKDWNAFKVESPCNFKPFDKVLVRDTDNGPWRCNIYSHKESGSVFPYKCIDAGYKQCILFDGYEDLVGTTTSPNSIYPA